MKPLFLMNVHPSPRNMIQDTQHNQTGDIAPVAPVPVKFKHGPKFDEVARERLLEAGSAMPRTRGGKGGMADLSWTAAYPLISHWLYKYYGDTKPILQHWASLKKYMDGVLLGETSVVERFRLHRNPSTESRPPPEPLNYETLRSSLLTRLSALVKPLKTPHVTQACTTQPLHPRAPCRRSGRGVTGVLSSRAPSPHQAPARSSRRRSS